MCTVIVDILIRSICIKETDLIMLVQVETKTVVSRLNILCKEHLIKKSVDLDPDAPPPEEGEPENLVTFYCEPLDADPRIDPTNLHQLSPTVSRPHRNPLPMNPPTLCPPTWSAPGCDASTGRDRRSRTVS
jgi:hypothetical protein